MRIHPALAAIGCTSALIASAITALPSPARACGGFFCDGAQPVNQQAERILFSRDTDGTVTAVIEIKYSGPSEEFAWMLPVAGTPEISVSSTSAFDRLQTFTNPQYRLNTTVEGECKEEDRSFDGVSAGNGNQDGGTSAEGPDDGVTVLSQGSVGPYDYVVISVNPDAEDEVAVALEWLQTNDFDVNDFGADRLRPYLEGGMNLLTFKLTKGNDAGAIRPVVLTFGTGLPMIPLRPTAVAAIEDMGVMVWVLGEERAVPSNYFSLELNEALINWTNPTPTYNNVIIQAANEAGGQGFVTEMAGDSAPLADAVWGEFDRSNWERIQETDWSGKEGELIVDALNQYQALDGVRDVVRDLVPLPEGVVMEDFLACIGCYLFGAPYDQADVPDFEPAPFIAALRTGVIEPMALTADILKAQPYATRLYTTMSPDEMTKDPAFDFNPDLGDVSATHMADRIIECSAAVRQFEAPWRVVLADGTIIRGFASDWPFATDDSGFPANARVLRVGNEGAGEVVTDNGDIISKRIAENNTNVEIRKSELLRAGGGGFCAVANPMARIDGPFGAGIVLAAGALVLRRRRTR
jgi:hypothetical protein